MRLNKKQMKEVEMDERFKRLEEKGEVGKFMKGKRKKLQQRNKVKKQAMLWRVSTDCSFLQTENDSHFSKRKQIKTE